MILWIWLIGSVLFYLPTARRTAWLTAGSQKQLDGFDIFMSGFVAGAIVAMAWFVTVPVWAIGRVFGGDDVMDASRKILSKPVPPSEKKKIKAQARQQEIIRHRQEVNAKERELGFAPTEWSK
jgi:hypothetical protein